VNKKVKELKEDNKNEALKTIERDEESTGANHFADGIYAKGHMQART
jgi:hypothetical protein